MNDFKTCTHTKDDGSPCQAIALRGKSYCYFHRRYYESTALPGDKNYQPPFLESNHSIILATTDLYRAFLSRKMGIKEVALGMQLLRLAAKAIADIEKAERQRNKEAAGAPASASSAEAGVVRAAAALKPVVDSTAETIGDRSSVAPASAISSIDHQPSPITNADRPSKSRYYDPEGCLSHLTRATGN